MIEIDIKDLTKKYKDVVAVDNLNIQIKKGEIFSLLGTNGAGKTTTIKILSTLLLPSNGEVKINNFDLIKDDKGLISRFLTYIENIVNHIEKMDQQRKI